MGCVKNRLCVKICAIDQQEKTMRKHTIFLLLAAVLAGFAASANPSFSTLDPAGVQTFYWESGVSVKTPLRQTLFAGESAIIRGRVVPEFNAGGAVIIPHGMSANFYWQYSDMDENSWFAQEASVTPLAVASTVFTAPAQAGQVRFFFQIGEATATNINYTLNGFLNIVRSPGKEPGVLPLPQPFIDFAAVKIVNPSAAPWLSAGDLPDIPEMPDLTGFATTNALAEVENALGTKQPKIMFFEDVPTTVEAAVNAINTKASEAQPKIMSMPVNTIWGMTSFVESAIQAISVGVIEAQPKELSVEKNHRRIFDGASNAWHRCFCNCE